MPVKPRRWNRLRKHNADWHKNRRATRRKRYRNLNPCPLGILISTAKTDSTLRQILAHGDFLLKSAPPDARQDPRLHPRAISPRIDLLLHNVGSPRRFRARLWLRLDPDRRRIAVRAHPRHALANLERFQLWLVQVHHLPPLAKTALHQQSRQRFLPLVRGREVDIPEIRSG